MTTKEQRKQRAVGIIVLGLMALIVLLLLLRSPEQEQLDVDFSFPAEPILTPEPTEPVISQSERAKVIEQVADVWRAHAPTPDEAEKAAKEQAPKEQQAPYLSGWAVQLWSLSHKESAQTMIEELNQAGFSAFMRVGQVNDKTLYRVYAGPELSKSKAQVLLDRLKQHNTLQVSQGLIVLLPE